MQIDIAALEQATLDAVAPEALETIPGWLLPFDISTVGRAISAVPLQHEALDSQTIAWIESRYAARRMQAQFRIADVAGLSNLQECLSSTGYRACQPTLTMTRNLAYWPNLATAWTPHISDEPTAAWKSVYTAADFDAIDGANRVKALTRSQCVTYAWIEDSQGPVSAATASISRGWLSLHGLRTLKRSQQQGCATALIQALGNLARARNMPRCFLQVEEENSSAISLYSRLGFQTAWRYHYWRKP